MMMRITGEGDIREITAIVALAACAVIGAVAFAQPVPPAAETGATPAAKERCAPGFAYDDAKRECIACDSPCETGQPGICRRGLIDCSAGKPLCRSAIQPGERVEVCNGEDDNCNGKVDEGFDKDSDGYTTCSGDCDDRNAATHPDAVERCDAKDNNCNGLTDDGFNIGGVCTAGFGDCGREGRRRCAPDGLAAECDVKAGPPSHELCDGRDNDCDGAIDNGLGEMACGVGACRRVVPTCHAGAATACTPGEPMAELCGDGIDNDCDGETDEGFAGAGQSCYAGVGACRRPGRVVCDATKLATMCDAVAGEPGAEICGNRVDDDCDGEVDTDTTGLNDACHNNLLGECRREGRRVCDAKTNQLACSAPDAAPRPEICDDRDNDCDGAIDNDVVERAPCGLGLCAGGQKERRCAAGAWGEWGECSSAAKAMTEICGNGKDDDCDGVIDADAPKLGEPCENQQIGGCTRQGKLVCGGADGSLVCSAPTVPPSEEICNGIDDDCDGAIDEGVTNACGGCGDLPGVVGSACRVSGGDECAVGKWACGGEVAGEMICVLDASATEGRPCRSDANPCTGDSCHAGRCEHPPVADGTACDDGDRCTSSDLCLAGNCAGGAMLSCEDGNACTEESCDQAKGCLHRAIGGGTMNACGGCGVLDAVPGDDCSVAGQPGLCAQGVFTCLPGGEIACVQRAFAIAESCNGTDDNCNGEIDENLGDATCGIGACQATAATCVGGKTQTCVPGEPQPESCGNMGADDDCNGVADDVAGLGQECPAAIGSCIMPGKKTCVGDATAPVCVPVDPRYAEDDDGNGVVNYCDHGATIAGAAEEAASTIASASKEAAGQRLFDASRTRAIMLPWSLAHDAAVIAPGDPDQAMLLVSGRAGSEGGIAALRPKDLQAGGPALFRSCLVPAAEAPGELLVVGTVADVIASTPAGYARYPRIASQIPSPLAGSYRCRLAGEPLVAGAVRAFGAKGAMQSCALDRVAAMELLSERPLAFVGAAVCRLPATSFWKRAGMGLGLDIVVEDASGALTYEFVPFATGEGEISGVRLAQLSKRYGGGLLVVASIGEKRMAGICRRSDDGWRCRPQSMETLKGPAAFAGSPSGRDEGPLIVVDADGAAFEVALGPDGNELKLLPAGGIAMGAGGAVVAGVSFPRQDDRQPTLVLGRDRELSAAAIRAAVPDEAPGALAAAGVLREIVGETILPQSSVDDVFPGDRFAFGRPHAMALLPLKNYGGGDLFAAWPIMSGSKTIGEMGFFLWNANDRPGGSLADIRFDGKTGSAKLGFVDPAGDMLAYRATIRAHHGGILDDWIDGFEGGRLRFSVKGDASGVGLWPIEIIVEATDPGGLTAASRVVMRRDGTVEAISETSGAQ